MSESKHVTYRENGNINAFHTVKALGEDIVVWSLDIDYSEG